MCSPLNYLLQRADNDLNHDPGPRPDSHHPSHSHPIIGVALPEVDGNDLLCRTSASWSYTFLASIEAGPTCASLARSPRRPLDATASTRPAMTVHWLSLPYCPHYLRMKGYYSGEQCDGPELSSDYLVCPLTLRQSGRQNRGPGRPYAPGSCSRRPC